MRTAAAIADNFQRRTSTRNEPYFVLRAANHEIIGTSEMYWSPRARDNGILACSRAAASARVVDGR